MDNIGRNEPEYVFKKVSDYRVRVQRKPLNKNSPITPKPMSSSFTKNLENHSLCLPPSNSEVVGGHDLHEIIRAKDTPKYIGVSKSTYHNYRNSSSKYFDSSFPALIAISRHCKGHLKHELNAWLDCKKVGGTGLGGENG